MGMGQKQEERQGWGHSSTWSSRHNVSHRISSRIKLPQTERARAGRREDQPGADHQHRLSDAILDPSLQRALCLRGLWALVDVFSEHTLMYQQFIAQRMGQEFIVSLKSEVGLGRVPRI